MALRDEFVFTLGGRKFYSIQDLDYFDDILIEEDRIFWENVQRGYIANRIFWENALRGYVKALQKQKELEFPVNIGAYKVEDAIKKFG